jgi:hypothetical protein
MRELFEGTMQLSLTSAFRSRANRKDSFNYDLKKMEQNESGEIRSKGGAKRGAVIQLAMEWLIPLSVWALIMLLIGLGVASKSTKAVAPPWYDAMEYFYKAKTTWQCVSKGDWGAVLEAAPSRRPPLTALILYPDGFNTSIQSFFFRSTFLPILFASLALLVPLAFIAVTRLERVLAVAMASAGASMPMFYHFEPNSIELNSKVDSYWGLVDPLLAAFAALAVAFVTLGVRRRSWVLGLVGWSAVALSIFIKPTGVLVAFVALGISLAEFLIRTLHGNWKSGDRITKKLIAGLCSYDVPMTLIAVGLSAATITVSLRSSYLGKDNIELFASGSKIVLGWLTGRPLLPVLLGILPETLGWFWLLALLGLVFFVAMKIRSSLDLAQVGLTVRFSSGTFILACAVYWWWFIASPQPRYLYPFLLIPVAWLSHDMFRVIKRRSSGFQAAAVAYFFAPALGVTILLWVPKPPPSMQKLLGVNLTAGTFAQEVNVGHKLLAECADQQKSLTLYSFAGLLGGVAISVQEYVRSILDEPGYSFNGIGPVDWRRAPGVRIDELVSSDLVICDRWIPDQIEESHLVSPRTYFEEVYAVVHCLSTMTNADGLQLISDGDLRAYRIVDREKFGATLARWARNVRWHTAFPEYNKGFFEKHSADRRE